ncbi:hypothetical protein Tco_0179121 [Tanacetum coccineum]
MGNKIKMRNSPDMFLGMILQFEFFEQSVLTRLQSIPYRRFSDIKVLHERLEDKGTDKAKIPRKRLKPGKHEHGNGRARKKPGGSYQKSNLQSTLGQQNQIMRQIPIKGQKGQFMGSSTCWQNLTSLNAFHWLIPSREDTLDDKKAQERWDFTLLTLTKKEQGVSITDCHAGNPCEISSDLTDENDLPMIGRLYGYDQEERVTEMRTRRFT